MLLLTQNLPVLPFAVSVTHGGWDPGECHAISILAIQIASPGDEQGLLLCPSVGEQLLGPLAYQEHGPALPDINCTWCDGSRGAERGEGKVRVMIVLDAFVL